MRRLPRHRATVRGAMLRTPSQPFEPTIANLASDSGCSTARLLSRSKLVLLRMAHRLRPRVDLLLMSPLRSQAQRQKPPFGGGS